MSPQDLLLTPLQGQEDAWYRQVRHSSGVCALCNFRGHTKSQCSTSVKAQQKFYQSFSRYADQNVYTRLRHAHPEWDMWRYDNVHQVPSEPHTNFDDIMREKELSKRRERDRRAEIEGNNPIGRVSRKRRAEEFFEAKKTKAKKRESRE